MDGLVEALNAKLQAWEPAVATHVRRLIADIIEAADRDALDLLRSRTVEQQVLGILDGA